MNNQIRRRVLVIEDDELDFHILERHLETLTSPQYELTRAPNLDAARELIAAQEFDAALVDYLIDGDKSGVEFIAELGGREAPFPMVVLTGMDVADRDREALLTGAYDYIDKFAITRDIVDRAIRFSIQSHDYEQRLRAAVSTAEEHASVNRTILAIVGHEMKSPLSSIVGYSEYLIEEAQSERTIDAANKMKIAAMHLEDFLRNIAEFVRLDAGAAKIESDVFRVGAILDETIAFFEPYANHKGIAISVESEAVEGLEIVSDRLRLRQILLNLIKNAVRYSDGGRIIVSAAHAGGRLTFTVADEGIGMSPERVADVMSRDYKPSAPSGAVDGGLGLGLSIVRKLAALIGGEFSLESVEGQGTTVRISLPLVASPRSIAA